MSHERSTLVLMFFLLGVLVFHPLFGGRAFESRDFNLVTSLGLLLTTFALRKEHKVKGVVVGLGFTCLIVNGFAMWQPLSLVADLSGHALFSLFYAFTASSLFQHILFSHSVSVRRSTLYEAVSVYLLLGLFWGTLYSFIEHIAPGSFSLGPGPHIGHLGWSDFLYHSFVTLTTLGYGDLVPVAPMARSLTILEAIVGVFFTTALIARLVAVYRPDDTDQKEEVSREAD